jgi:hypothetical protein
LEIDVFQNFEASYPCDDGKLPSENASSTSISHSDFLSRYGGMTFSGGLYRIVRTTEVASWNLRVESAFPDFKQRLMCFAFDWAGRAFALDSKRLVGGNAAVTLFEPGTGEALEIPCDLRSFHEEELIEFGEAALGTSFFDGWRDAGGPAPQYSECIGYQRPLFLGGTDDIGNLEISDLEVYWHLLGQLIVKTRGLPPGTRVNINL